MNGSSRRKEVVNVSIISARVDNRLLHGIVATQWAPFIGAARVMVIDDHIANDPTLKSGMKMGKPAGCALSIINEETAYANFKAGKYDDHSVFVIVQDPVILLKLISDGQKIGKVIVGGTVDPPAGVESVQVSKRAYVTKPQEEVYRAIAAAGTPVSVQYLLNDKELPISDFIKL